jgi:hypothetical protein
MLSEGSRYEDLESEVRLSRTSSVDRKLIGIEVAGTFLLILD